MAASSRCCCSSSVWHVQHTILVCYLGVSWNGDTPNSMVYKGKPYQNGWFGATPISGNPETPKNWSWAKVGFDETTWWSLPACISAPSLTKKSQVGRDFWDRAAMIRGVSSQFERGSMSWAKNGSSGAWHPKIAAVVHDSRWKIYDQSVDLGYIWVYMGIWYTPISDKPTLVTITSRPSRLEVWS